MKFKFTNIRVAHHIITGDRPESVMDQGCDEMMEFIEEETDKKKTRGTCRVT